VTSLFHFSDNHGRVPVVSATTSFDAVVCSGDFLPDRYPRKEERTRLNLPHVLLGTPAFQEQWLRTQLDNIVALARDKPFLSVPGNHDSFNMVPILREAGVDAHDLTDRLVESVGLRFYGFPYIPWAGGSTHFELMPPQMEAKMAKVIQLLNEGAIDVLVAHCPPYKILDKAKSGTECGNPWMLKALATTPPEKLPKAYLCGHVHMAAGDGTFRGMYISNAATKLRMIPIAMGG